MTKTEASSAKAKSAAKAKAASAFNFEQSLGQLEELVSSMEEGELSLEDSLAAFERGIKLTRECQAALKEAEQKVQVLLDESGATRPLGANESANESEGDAL